MGAWSLSSPIVVVLIFLPGVILPIRNFQTDYEAWVITSCLCFRRALEALKKKKSVRPHQKRKHKPFPNVSNKQQQQNDRKCNIILLTEMVFRKM